jgi:hypothetical protein
MRLLVVVRQLLCNQDADGNHQQEQDDFLHMQRSLLRPILSTALHNARTRNRRNGIRGRADRRGLGGLGLGPRATPR